MPTDNDTSADERAECCGRLDPINCPCPPPEDDCIDVDHLERTPGELRVTEDGAALARIHQAIVGGS